MAQRFYINTSKEATLLASVGSGDVTFNLNGVGLQNVPPTPFYIRVDPDTSSEEVCLVTGGSATSLTVTRGYDGTATTSHSAGAVVRHVVTAEFFNKADAHVENTSNVHGTGVGNNVVGTGTLQTLTNKTVNASVIDVAHSTSPAASQAFRAHADAATGRHGFVWDNTGGSTGKAFLAKVSGVDKTYVSGDGNLTVGGTSTTTGLTNTGTLTNTGAVNVTGNVAVTGSETVSSDLTVTGNANVSTDAIVNGQVKLVYPGGSHGQRVRIESETNSVALAVMQAGTLGTLDIYGNGQVDTSYKLRIYDKASPVVASVANTGIPDSPTTGMLIWDETNRVWQRYNGTAYRTAQPYANMLKTAAQSINSGVLTALDLGTAATNGNDHGMWIAGTPTRITIATAGRYRVEFSGSWQSAHATSTVRICQIVLNGNTSDLLADQRYLSVLNNLEAHNLAFTHRFAASDYIEVYVYHEHGSAINFAAGVVRTQINVERVSN